VNHSSAATTGASSAAGVNAAVSALEQVLRFEQPADGLLSAFFRQHKSGARDRALIAELVYAVLRRKPTLEAIAASHPAPAGVSRARQLALLGLLQLQGWSLRQLDAVTRKPEQTWLTEVHAASDVKPDSLAQALDLPEWLAAMLQPQYDEASLRALMRSLNAPAPLDLRVNLLKAERDAVQARLAADGIVADLCALAPTGLRLRGKPALNKHPLFLDGSIEVQDEGSQLLGLLLQPRRGEMVVDFCAGAGGKTLQLGALMRSTGRLYALDISEKRLAKLKPRMARAGLSNVHPICISGENDQRVRRLAGKIDRVLVDAPCSGLGTLRRNPDLKWRQSAQSVEELTQKQTAILAAAARLLKPGGRLVYATCSLLDAENVRIADAFAATHPEFVRRSAQEILAAQGIALNTGDDLRLRPDLHGTDGFYAAVFERRA
jgi:16S rRNA (cytosine967-C5)-methyltransferase